MISVIVHTNNSRNISVNSSIPAILQRNIGALGGNVPYDEIIDCREKTGRLYHETKPSQHETVYTRLNDNLSPKGIVDAGMAAAARLSARKAAMADGTAGVRRAAAGEIGANRLFKKSGDIRSAWKQRLNLLFGSKEWFNEFYRMANSPMLFREGPGRMEKVSMETIGRCYVNKLKKVFAGDVEESGVLRNSCENPLCLLRFAVGYERGKKTALNMAKHLLGNVR